MQKKFILLFVLIFLLSLYNSQSKVHPNAIGLRLGGDGNDNGVELSYQMGVNKENRFEFDLGFGSNKNNNRMFLSGLYHWDWNIKGGLNWFVGPGATLSIHSDKKDNGGLSIGLGGQIGLEYDFNYKKTPLLVSLDLRPMWDFIGNNNHLGWGAALGVRYTF
jgi:hypothetical protein